MVVPERKALEDWATNNNESGDFKSLCNNMKARKYILDELNSTAKKHQVCEQTFAFLLKIKALSGLVMLSNLRKTHVASRFRNVEDNPFGTHSFRYRKGSDYTNIQTQKATAA